MLTKTYIQDVVERNNLKGDSVINTLVAILASSIGSFTNPTKLVKAFASKNMKTSDVTLSNDIDYLIEAFMIHKVQRYDIKRKKIIHSPYKFYFTDIGIRNCRLNFRQQEQRIMENIVYNELVMRGYTVDVGKLYERKNQVKKSHIKKTEVDFICNLANKRYYIQVANTIDSNEKTAQEQKYLLQIKDGFKKIIIVKDAIKTPLQSKRNLYNWFI